MKKFFVLGILCLSSVAVAAPAVSVRRPVAPPAPPVASAPAAGAQRLDVDGLKEKYWSSETSSDVRVIQNRTYTKELKISLAPHFTTLSADPFQDIIGAGASLGFNPTEYLGIHAFYSWFHPTSSAAARAFLTAATFGANSNPVRHLIGGELAWSLLYGKLSLLGKAILHFDLYTHAGGGYLFTDNGNTVAPWAGLGQQLFLTKWLTLKVDYRFMYWRENVVNRSTPSVEVGAVIGQRNVFANMFTFGLNLLFP